LNATIHSKIQLVIAMVKILRMKYKVQPKDLERCFRFAVKYHLDESKNATNRTTGQYRGLGGIIDNFFIGKIIEIGVASILEGFTAKKMILDFQIYTITRDKVTDPDIIAIKEKNKRRYPKLFVEIKNVSINDRWVGLTTEQFNTIMKNKIVKTNPTKAFIIGASLLSRNSSKDSDLLGVFMKTRIPRSSLLKEFCDTKDLYVEIQYIMRAEELEEKGVNFNEGSYMYETEIFHEVTELTRKRIINPENSHIYSPVKAKQNVLPIIMRDRNPKPKEFGRFKYTGNLRIYHKKNVKSDRMYVYCISHVRVKNKVLGTFDLEKGKFYECFFTAVGWNPKLKRNNIWIAQRNLENVISSDVKSRIKEIAYTI